MYFSTWDLLLNVALLLFWFRIWLSDDRNVYFNPHLSSLWRFSEQLIVFLRAIFFRMPSRWIAVAMFLFLLIFRGLTFYGLAMRNSNATWLLRLGFEESHLYPGNAGVLAFLAFSLLSFAIFLFTFWGVALLYAGRRNAAFNHAADTLYNVSLPFSLAKTQFRPAILLVLGILLGLLLNFDITAASSSFLADSMTASNLAKCALSSLLGLVKVLSVVQLFMVVLIIGSWVSMFATSQELMFFSKDWIDLLLGPLRRFPLRIGPLDLTPIVFYFAIGFVAQILTAILSHSYADLP